MLSSEQSGVSEVSDICSGVSDICSGVVVTDCNNYKTNYNNQVILATMLNKILTLSQTHVSRLFYNNQLTSW